jgi:hypothetical protein
MSSQRLRGYSFATCLAASLAAMQSHAEPYLAVQTGFKCAQCHVNPTGGALRTAFGDAFAQTLMPAKHLDTGADTWTGELNRFLAVGVICAQTANSTKRPAPPRRMISLCTRRASTSMQQ